jgi:hypothetical protein
MAKAHSGSITASTPRANGTIDLSDMMELILSGIIGLKITS